MEIIERVFKGMFESYKKMFKTHIPTINDGALPEANQTYYFCNNLVREINEGLKDDEIKASASLEVPVTVDGEKKKVDGIVVSPSTNEIFYIEAKRLKAGNKITKELIYTDIKKVLEADRKSFFKNKVRNFNRTGGDLNEYIVILADLWLEGHNKNRNEIPFWWCGVENKDVQSNVFDDIRPKFDNPEQFFIDSVIPSKLKWSNENQYIRRFKSSESPEEKLPENYCLLVGSAKLPTG